MMILLAEQAASHSHSSASSNQAGSVRSLGAVEVAGHQQQHMEPQQHNHQFKQQSHFNLAPPQTAVAPSSQLQQQQQHYLTIEELKLALNSCWLCGCNWQADHVSLDCPECGGYALTRPCPSCDGRCKQTWRRNIKDTHDRHRAAWSGQCDNVQTHDSRMSLKQNCFELGGIQIRPSTSRNIISGLSKQTAPIATTTTSNTSATLSPRLAKTSTNTTATNLILPASSSSCCSSHPSSAASSDSEESYDEMLMMNKR